MNKYSKEFQQVIDLLAEWGFPQNAVMSMHVSSNGIDVAFKGLSPEGLLGQTVVEHYSRYEPYDWRTDSGEDADED